MALKNTTMFIFTIFMALVISIAIFSFSNESMATANQKFIANLTGKQEVPPIKSEGSGDAIFSTTTNSTNKTIAFLVNATGIHGVTQGHIHNGVIGKNGPIIATLFVFNPNQNPNQNGILVNGSIAAINLEGPMQGKTVSDLLSLMKDNATYINIHTQQNPNGEIRGQLIKTS